MEKQYVKALIELATSFEVADDVMNQYSGCNSDEERIHYLTELFDCKINLSLFGRAEFSAFDAENFIYIV